MSARLYCGDVRAVLATLPEASVQCVVTSPPYWGLRDYGMHGQLGLERTPDEYVVAMVGVFREVRRVLRDDGVLWLNIGDSYATAGGAGWQGKNGQRADRRHTQKSLRHRDSAPGCKPKDLVGIPWLLAFGLRADGWYLRSDVIWHKPNPMPESVTDRPTKAHEYVFLLSKSEGYEYNADAIAESVSPNTHSRISQHLAAQVGSDRANGGTRADRPMKAVVKAAGVNPKAATSSPGSKQNASFARAVCLPVLERNARTVWTVPSQGYVGAHFATFPEELARRCILAGSKAGDTVLDPFGGSGTTAAVTVGHGRSAIYVDLNPDYLELARQRIGPMLCEDAESVA